MTIAHHVATDQHQPKFIPTGKTWYAPTKPKVIAGILIILLLTLGISYPLSAVSLSEVTAAADGHIGHESTHHVVSSAPDQIHGCIGDTPRSFVVMWSTDTYTDSHVIYGTEPSTLALTAIGNCARLTSQMQEGRSYLHRTELRNLELNQVYYYRAVSHGQRSKLYQFKTWPSEDHKWSPRFIVYGDMGVASKMFHSLEQDVATGRYDGILHIGDFAYDLFGRGGSVGDKFMKMISPFAGNLSYFTSPGDHEYPAEFLQYRYRFSMPSTPWPIPLHKMWYSFNAGLAHIISISTEVYDENERYLYKFSMYRWLLDDLAEANKNRANRPWIIVMGHKPMYCSNLDNKIDCRATKVRKDLEDLFFQQGVDLYISGHEHSYERTWPIYREQLWGKSYVNPGAMVQLVIGLGAVEYGSEVFTPRQPEWSAIRSNVPRQEGYGRLFIENATHLHWEVFSPTANKIIDRMVIVQKYHGSFKIFGNMTDAPIVRRNIPFIMPMFYEVSAGTSGMMYLLVVGCILCAAIFMMLRRRCPFFTKRLVFTVCGGSKRT